MADLVVQMNKSKKKNNNNIIKRVSKATSRKFAFLTGGKNIRNYEAVIGLSNEQFKVSIDSKGDLTVEKLKKTTDSHSELRS